MDLSQLVNELAWEIEKGHRVFDALDQMSRRDRKLSFGTQSAKGSRYLERILTVSETCRLQNRNAFQYLVALMEAKFKGTTAPSLLPNQPAVTNVA